MQEAPIFSKISHSPLANDSVNALCALLTAGGLLLIVTNVEAAQLAAGDTFKLFNAASYNGAFSSVILPVLPFGLDLEHEQLFIPPAPFPWR